MQLSLNGLILFSKVTVVGLILFVLICEYWSSYLHRLMNEPGSRHPNLFGQFQDSAYSDNPNIATVQSKRVFFNS